MATVNTKTLRGRTLRLTLLDACGAPVVGAASSVVTNGFITVTWAPQVLEGTTHTVKNAFGELEINEQEEPEVQWFNVTLQAIGIQPAVAELMSNASEFSDGTDVIGSTFGSGRNAVPVGVEVWSKVAGRNCVSGDPEWGYFASPFVVNGVVDGNLEVANAPLNMGFKGQAVNVPAAWGTGPYADNPMLAAAGFPVGQILAAVRTTVQPPSVTAGLVAITE